MDAIRPKGRLTSPAKKQKLRRSRAGRILAGTPNNPMPKTTVAAKGSSKKSKRLAAAATGGAAAGCAAVACCCPCCLLGLIVLTAARVPAEIGRRVARKTKQLSVSDLKGSEQKCVNGGAPVSMTAVKWPGKSPAAEVSEMEEKMWAEFAGTGFWRSSSQRE